MKKILITSKKCPLYAQKNPALPPLSFVLDGTYDLEDYLAASVIKNGHGIEVESKEKPSAESKEVPQDKLKNEARTVDPEPKETPEIKPEIKEKPQKYRGKKRNRS